jgi:hypothetical protein
MIIDGSKFKIKMSKQNHMTKYNVCIDVDLNFEM